MDHHPPADVVIDEGLIRGLLERQLPQFAGLPLRPAAHGWDNEMWRLGADLVVRLPRRREAAQLLRHEVRWLPVLARQLPVSIPTPVAGGVPDDTYPYPWAVLPWLPGHPASSLAPSQRDAYAGEFGQALRALHRVAPSDAPINPFRGGDLRTRRSAVADRLAGLEHADELLAMVADAIAARAWAGEPRWLHGDPHPFNTMVGEHGLSALIDFGDLCRGDPASDLGVIWLHFTAAGRARFVAAYEPDEGTLRRARGWAVSFASFMRLLATPHPLRECADHAIAELVGR